MTSVEHPTAPFDVVTLTLNPALDISTSVAAVEPWRKLRCEAAQLDPGGGGINVARVVQALGGRAIAVAALGGHVGSEVAAALARQGVPLTRVQTSHGTRQNFAVTERTTGRQFRFIQGGDPMTRTEWKRCLEVTVTEARSARCLVASGSLPAGVPDDFYAQLAHRVAPLNVPIIVDTSGPALLAAILAPVALVKPSVNELQSLVHRELHDASEYEGAARELLSAGQCRAIIVSLGGEGALLVPRDAEAELVRAPAVEVRSTIGAGDSMVGAIALQLARRASLTDALRFGVAAGTAAVLHAGTALCRADDVAAMATHIGCSGDSGQDGQPYAGDRYVPLP